MSRTRQKDRVRTDGWHHLATGVTGFFLSGGLRSVRVSDRSLALDAVARYVETLTGTRPPLDVVRYAV